MSHTDNHGYHTPLQSDETNKWVNKDNHGQMKQTSERVTKTTMVISLHYSQMKLTNKRVNKDNCGLHYNQMKPETNHQVSYKTTMVIRLH